MKENVPVVYSEEERLDFIRDVDQFFDEEQQEKEEKTKDEKIKRNKILRNFHGRAVSMLDTAGHENVRIEVRQGIFKYFEHQARKHKVIRLSYYLDKLSQEAIEDLDAMTTTLNNPPPAPDFDEIRDRVGGSDGEVLLRYASLTTILEGQVFNAQKASIDMVVNSFATGKS